MDRFCERVLLELHHDAPDIVQCVNVRRTLPALKSGGFTLEIRPFLFICQLGYDPTPLLFRDK